MDFFDIVSSRKSIRSFSDKSIPPEILEKILEAGRLAPSCQNRQCWRFIVVDDKEKIKSLTFNSGLIGTVNFFLKEAPLAIVACADIKANCRLNEQNYYLVDTAISFQQMMLTAWSFGIGSCWLAAFNENKVKSNLKIPDRFRVVALSPFGYPKEKEGLYSKAVSTFAGSKNRKRKEDIIHFNEW
ncbi:MAG: nitroreductase family protein [Candidatus Cloacimonetes bacterium]|nr:nitroreductase family protein [Candidatus Cloacimonadota bacterium]